MTTTFSDLSEDARPLRDSISSGVRWTAVGQIARQASTMVISIVLTRILSPDDYGIVAAASVLIGFLVLFQNLGTTAAIIQRRQISSELLSSCLIMNFVIGTMITLGTWLAAPAVAAFYHKPIVGTVFRVLGFTFLITSAGLVHGALLNRTFQFDRLIKADLVSSLIDGCTAISLALMGFKVWALVVGTLAGSIVRTLLIILWSGWVPKAVFRYQAMREIAGFSMNLTGFNIVNYLERNADNFIVGGALGTQALGYYSRAFSLYQKPLDGLTGVMTKVMYPALARLQDDKRRTRHFFLRANGAIAFVVFPVMTALGVLARPFVMGVLGPKWEPSIIVLMILAPVGIMQANAVTTNQLYLAMGRSDLRLWWGVSAGGFITLSFLVGIHWGYVGVASALAIVMVPLTYLSFYFSFRMIDMVPADLLRELRPYLAGTVVMGAVVLAVRLPLEARGVGPLWVLSIGTAVSMAVYGAMMFWLKPVALRDMLMMVPERFHRSPMMRLAWAWAGASGPGVEKAATGPLASAAKGVDPGDAAAAKAEATRRSAESNP